MTSENWIDLVVGIVPLVAAAAIGAGGFFAYGRQKRIDRREELIRKRREIYAKFLVALQSFAQVHSDQAQLDYSLTKAEIQVYGSDKVVMAQSRLSTLLEKVGRTPEDGPRTINAYAELVHSMREDCYESTRLSVDELVKLAPLRSGGGATPS